MAEFKKSTLREYFESVVIAVILALFVRTFVVQAFKIPTGSMENNLLIGDHLLVNKFVFAPTVSGLEQKLLPIDPVRRGDILVFKYPQDPEREPVRDATLTVVQLSERVLVSPSDERDQRFVGEVGSLPAHGAVEPGQRYHC